MFYTSMVDLLALDVCEAQGLGPDSSDSSGPDSSDSSGQLRTADRRTADRQTAGTVAAPSHYATALGGSLLGCCSESAQQQVAKLAMFYHHASCIRALDRCCSRARTPSTRPSGSSVLQTSSLVPSIPLEMVRMEGDAKPRPPQTSAPATPSISATAPRFLLGQHEAASRRQGAQNPNFFPSAARWPAARDRRPAPSGRA